ncbi:hypothetical protein M408DRAFT_145118 [Serendipita vermifera MAFF 305830]|uniref:Uncharacterized protein n=1 Tax=Serendipita vermifera MAFF 305830 TaxID=933852 RepID=A0A0C3AUM0_SERVB|nr:hypothetical protein M408DRAFT_145118 [Serendipita vermifera MAFF 305830]
MARSRILVAKRPIASSQPVQRHASTFANEAFASSSSRLNAHVLLGLSMLVLSANARPLDTPGQANNIGIGNLLSGTAAEWASSKGGLGEQIAESFLKLLHLNGATPEQPADDSLLE